MPSKTETRILAAMQQLQVWEAPATIFGFRSILDAIQVLANGRKPSEAQISAALRKLVASGLVIQHVTTGMGGGFTDYRLA